MDIDELDLNLLKVFRALIDEKSVTRAAARLRLSQSATSSALARLRKQIQDPLFIKTQQGMIPTARAQALDEPIRFALDQVSRMLASDGSFRPLSSGRAFRIMVTDHALTRLSPLLADLLSEDAPLMRFDISSVGTESDYERLRSGAVDLMISFIIVQPPPSFKALKLFSERHVLLGRKNHPRINPHLTLREFVELDHVVVTPRGSWIAGPIDQVLAEKGLKRKIRMTVPHYLAAPLPVAYSDFVVALPESIADEYVKLLPVAKYEIPLDTRPFTVSMVWHERNHNDPAHRWLRTKVRDACRAL